MKSEILRKATFITFYSFKGGVGRSMALINTACILAGRRGFRVLVLDLDLEAPGLTYLDAKSYEAASPEVQLELPCLAGFVDLLGDALDRGEAADIFKLSDLELETKYSRAILIPELQRGFSGGSLRIMPSGRCDHKYSQRLDALNLNALYREGVGEPLIRAFKKRIAESGLYDYVLVDSRTGISEGAGICTRDLADHVMILSGLNRQNVEGTSEFLREFRLATDGKKSIQIILSPVPNGEDSLLDSRRKVAGTRFQEAWGSAVDLTLEIPYHPQLALTEDPHIFRRRRGYLFEAYRQIEISMLLALGHDAHTFRQRVTQSLEAELYSEALLDLNHMIRLENGRGVLSQLVVALLEGKKPRRGPEEASPQKSISFEDLASENEGRSVADFIVEHLPLDEFDFLPKRLLQSLAQKSTALADKLLNRIVHAAANNADMLGDYAVTCEQVAIIDRAEAFYELAIQANPNHADNLANYADFLNERGRFNEADACYKRALEIEPRRSPILGYYALFLASQRRFVEAELAYKRALEVEPGNSQILGNFALFLKNRRRLEEAEVLYKMAIEADPKRANNYGNYARLLEMQGRFEEAENFFKRGLKVAPRRPLTLSNYALFLTHRERFNEAEEFFKLALESDPKRLLTLGNYALLLKHLGRTEEAEAYYKLALETDPKSSYVLTNYAVLLTNQGRMEEAEAFYKRAFDADPKNANNLGNYGQFFVANGRLQEGEENLRQSLRRLELTERSNRAEICFSLWLVIRMQGRDATEWERQLKFLILQGFKRPFWNFDRMLEQAQRLVSSAEFDYASKLAAAVLDENKVAELASIPYWVALEPLPPMNQSGGVE